jgi:hypothetical protein
MFVLLLVMNACCFSHRSREHLLAASFSPFFPKKSILVRGHLLPYLTAEEAKQQGLLFHNEHGWVELPSYAIMTSGCGFGILGVST